MMGKTQIRAKDGAFTLIELLVVIAIIGILAGLLLPVLANAKKKANAMVGMSNKGQLQLAWQAYTDDHDGMLANNVLKARFDYKRASEGFQGTWCPHGPYLSIYRNGTLKYSGLEAVSATERDWDVQEPLFQALEGPGRAVFTGDNPFTSRDYMEKYPIYYKDNAWGWWREAGWSGKLFMHAQLGQYVDDAKMFLSPGEGVTLIRSVAMNINVGRTAEDNEDDFGDERLECRGSALIKSKASGNIVPCWTRESIDGKPGWKRVEAPKYESDYTVPFKELYQAKSRESEIMSPSELFVFIDQNMDADPSPLFKPPFDQTNFIRENHSTGDRIWKVKNEDGTVDNNWQAIHQDSMATTKYGVSMPPSRLNGGRYSLGFADGHAEMKGNESTSDDNRLPDPAAWQYLARAGWDKDSH